MSRPRNKDTAELPDEPPEMLANDLVLELGDMAIDVIEAQIKYWTTALGEAKRRLGNKVS